MTDDEEIIIPTDRKMSQEEIIKALKILIRRSEERITASDKRAQQYKN